MYIFQRFHKKVRIQTAFFNFPKSDSQTQVLRMLNFAEKFSIFHLLKKHTETLLQYFSLWTYIMRVTCFHIVIISFRFFQCYIFTIFHVTTAKGHNSSVHSLQCMKVLTLLQFFRVTEVTNFDGTLRHSKIKNLLYWNILVLLLEHFNIAVSKSNSLPIVNFKKK